MKGGLSSYVRRVWQNEELMWKLLLAGAFAVSLAGTCVVLGGLAAVTNFCLDHPPLGVGAGIKMEYPLTALSAEVVRIQRATVTQADGHFDCGRYFRFDWTLWALQFVFMCIFGFIWWKRCLRRFMPGLVAIGTAVTGWHMYKADFCLTMEPWTKGELHTGGFVVGLGLVTCIIGNFSMLLSAGPYSEREGRQVRCSSAATEANFKQSEDNLRGTAGKSSCGGAGDSPCAEFIGQATEV